MTAVDRVTRELDGARATFPAFNSAHEGWAVLREEVDELWEEVKQRQPDRERMRKEATQVAAMAIRFLHDVCGVPL